MDLKTRAGYDLASITRSTLHDAESGASNAPLLDFNYDADHELDTLVFRRQQNASQPIFKLPPELFTVVFFDLQGREILDDFDPLSSVYIQHAWYRILHVCSALRAIALATPVLWNIIDFPRVWSSEQVEAHMLYSQGQSLSIRMPGIGYTFDVALQASSIIVDGSQVSAEELAHLSKPMPNLRRLILESGRDTVVPCPLLGGQCSKLEFLSIDQSWSIIDPAGIAPLSSLRFLRLYYPLITNFHPSLMQILQGCRSLEVLVMYLQSWSLSPNIDGTIQIDLTSLKYLHACGQDAIVAATLQAITAPSKALYVDQGPSIENMAFGVPHNVAFLECLAFHAVSAQKHPKTLECTLLLTLNDTRDGAADYGHIQFGKDFEHTDVEVSSQRLLFCKFYWDGFPTQEQPIFQHIWILRLDAEYKDTKRATWGNLNLYGLRFMPNITHLIIQDHDAAGLWIESICKWVRSTHEENQRTIACVSLDGCSLAVIQAVKEQWPVFEGQDPPVFTDLNTLL